MAERIFHPYDQLEEFHAGMWRIVKGSQRKDYIAAAADLMRSPDDFREALLAVVEKWPISCEANLTSDSSNRIAWLGQAACCLAVNSPEEATRVAWHTMPVDDQIEANRIADEALQLFLTRHRSRRAVPDLVDMML